MQLNTLYELIDGSGDAMIEVVGGTTTDIHLSGCRVEGV